MTNVEGRKPEGAPERSPKAGEGAASGVDGNVAKRFSVQRKMAVVARMLRGEPVESAPAGGSPFLRDIDRALGRRPHLSALCEGDHQGRARDQGRGARHRRRPRSPRARGQDRGKARLRRSRGARHDAISSADEGLRRRPEDEVGHGTHVGGIIARPGPADGRRRRARLPASWRCACWRR